MTNGDAPTRRAPTGRAKMRLALCFDGTWNKPEDHTNVSRIHSAIPDVHSGCPDQLKFYDSGVGTELGNAVRGGATGKGLDVNILQGYCWLIEQYEPGNGELEEKDKARFRDGDEIFVFGFSRGAFTARSLVGLVNRCGIPKREKFGASTTERRPIDVKHPIVRRAWELYRKEYPGNLPSREQTEVVAFRKQHCWDVKVKFIGVWDTVGALGIPVFGDWFSPLQRRKYSFHDTRLGRVVENAFHAVAIDEHRKDFDVALWTGAKAETTERVEQRWFPGAHANVGGGYDDDLLPDPPMCWIAECARQCGLEFSTELMPDRPPTCQAEIPIDFKLLGNEYLTPVRDSFKEMGFGLYRWVKLNKRHVRKMLLSGVNETIDPTAYLKWANDDTYRPHNLAFAGRTDVYR